MKRVQGHSGFTFRCHDAINVRKRERRRERQSEKHQTILISKDKNSKVRENE